MTFHRSYTHVRTALALCVTLSALALGLAVTGPASAATTSTSDAGALPLGQASYPVPSNAVFVSPGGSDSSSGKILAPVRTIARAAALAPSNGTIVLRAGAHHETVTLPGHKALTIQNYPGEAAWLDGSTPVTGWVKSGSVWVRSGWTAEFDSSPTYTKGAADGNRANWRFVNSAHPMAAHPDQVFVNRSPLEQVSSRAAVGPGKFYADYAANQLVMGTDPSGQQVRASDLGGAAITVTAAGTVIRGIAIARYATSVPNKGSLRVWANNVTLENVLVKHSATQGIALQGTGIKIRKVTSSDNGLNGFEGGQSDGPARGTEHDRLDGRAVRRPTRAPPRRGSRRRRRRTSPPAGRVRRCIARS